jgi:hypothetical protein
MAARSGAGIGTGGAEPGRLVEDDAGRVHVALRGSGELATIDPALASLIARRPACIGPRGVAYHHRRRGDAE